MICAIFSVIVGVFGSLMILVFLMAGGANSSPAQIRAIKRWMWVTLLAGIACAVGGVWLTRRDYVWWGCFVGAAPAIFVFVSMLWLTIEQERNRVPPR